MRNTIEHKKTWGFVVLLILGALIAFLLSWMQTNNINQAVISTIILIISGATARVVIELAERVASPVSDFINNLLSSYKKPYLEYLVYKYRYFETRGLSAQPEFNLELSQLFVDLDLQKKSRENLNQTDNGIWFWLGHENSDLAPKLVLLGAPGSGKTTLLKQVTLELAKNENTDIPKKLLRKIPILLFMRDLEKPVTSNPNISLGEIIISTIKENITTPPASWFHKMLTSGNCILMLDGLDEIADNEARKKVVDWVQDKIHFYEKSIFVITSRPFGYENNKISGVITLKIIPYSREKIEKFIHNWYLANEIAKSNGRDDLGVRWAAKNSADDLMQRLGIKPALAALAINPLLLTMITTVHSLKEHLPGRRVELFRDIFEVTLDRRSKFVWSQNNLNTPQKLDVLRTLAYYMMKNELRTISKSQAVNAITQDLQKVGARIGGEEFLSSIENDSGLILELENGIYGFAHFTFQEYLASTYIINDKENASDKNLLEYVGEPWWSETILLYSAQTNATRIIEKCIEEGTYNSLGLATDCLDEALKIDQAIREKVEQVLNEKMESNDENVRAMASKAKLASRLRWMVRIDEKTHIDSTPITNIEYQMFIDEMRKTGKHYQPDHWVDDRFPVSEGLNPILGVRPEDAHDYCKWLTSRDIWSANYNLPNAKDAYLQPIHEYVYWVIDESGRKIPHPHQNAVIEITEKTIIDQLIHDFHKIEVIAPKIGEQDKQKPTTEELLSKKAYIPRSAHMGEKSFAMPDRALEKRSLEEYDARFSLERVNQIDTSFSVEISKIIGFTYFIFTKYPTPIEEFISWFPVDSKPFFFRAGLNIATTYIEMDNVLNDLISHNLIDNHYRFLLPETKKILSLLLRRNWIELPQKDRNDCYLQLRWSARVCLSVLAHAISLTNNKNELILNVLRDMFVDSIILEKRVGGDLKSFEGIRVIKEIPSKI